MKKNVGAYLQSSKSQKFQTYWTQYFQVNNSLDHNHVKIGTLLGAV